MTSTNVFNIPFLDGTELVRDYPDFSEDLADAVEAGLLVPVSTARIANNAVTTAKIGNGQVTAAKLGAGTILQVVSTAKTDVFSMTSSFQDVPGLAVTITPTSATSKILVIAQVSAGLSTRLMLRLAGGNTGAYVGDGGSGDFKAVTGQNSTTAGAGYNPTANLLSHAMVVQDSPATTAATTYRVQITNAGSGTAFVNRNSLNSRFGASSITVMEVAG